MNDGIGASSPQGLWRALSALVCGAMVTLAPAPALADQGSSSPGWRKVSNLSTVIGVDGKSHTASCSTLPGTDPSFKFWAKRGKSKNLVVYFEGGGACWNDLSCTFPALPGLPVAVPQFFTPSITPDINPANYDGIFNSNNTANPVKDWDFVYIPYCTGDVHSGSATRTYSNVGHPVLPLPAMFDIQHRGFDNFMVVLDWIKKNVDAPERLLVTGSSAGGYGASLNFPWLQRVFPKARLSVLADASQGVLTPAFDTQTPGRGSWNTQIAPWVFGTDPTKVASPDVLRIAAAAFPKARMAQFTTHFDEVQIGFYGLAQTTNPSPSSCPTNLALDWNRQMIKTMKSYARKLDNYRHYLAFGQYHTILGSAQFYTENSAGVAFKDWLGDMLRGDGDDDDDDDDRHASHGRWQNVACPGCLVVLPCQ